MGRERSGGGGSGQGVVSVRAYPTCDCGALDGAILRSLVVSTNFLNIKSNFLLLYKPHVGC